MVGNGKWKWGKWDSKLVSNKKKSSNELGRFDIKYQNGREFMFVSRYMYFVGRTFRTDRCVEAVEVPTNDQDHHIFQHRLAHLFTHNYPL